MEMINNSLILTSINNSLSFFQEKCSYLYENSFFLKKIDSLIFFCIIGVFILSTFASSDAIGYLGLVALFLTIVKLFVKKDEKIEMNLFEFFLLIYFLIVIISLAGSSLLYLSFKGFLKTFTYLGFYFSAVQYYKNNLTKIPFTIAIIALCTSFEGLVGLYQNFGQVSEISTWQDVSSINPEDVMTRVYGTLLPLNPNLLGGYFVASIPFIFGFSVLNFIDKKIVAGLISLLLGFLTSYTLILTGCRGAYVSIFVMFIGFFALLAKFIWKSLNHKQEFFKKIYLSLLGFMVLVSSFIVIFVSSVKTRVLSIFAMRGDSSTSFRFNVYNSVLNMIKDNWLLGIGLGNQNFREIYGLYMKTGFDALSAYNIFLEIAVESGIFALIVFVAFLFILGRDALKFIFNNNDLKLEIIISLSFVAILAILVHGLVDTVFFRPQIQFVFWVMVAFISTILNANSKACNS